MKENLPLVSVICVCYNHEQFVIKALESVIFQTYRPIEIIVIDDASTDHSVAKILKFMQEIPHYGLNEQIPIQFIQNSQNLGNCATFNIAFQKAKGQYIIDLATDDVLLDERIAQQVKIMENSTPNVGVIFSNALLIDATGKPISYHYPLNQERKSKKKIPTGDIFGEILKRYFICTPTMMIRKSVLDDLNGYDEALSYEDFDFWVRSSRQYLYYYQDEVTTLKRILPTAHSTKFYQTNQNPHLTSTLKILYKAEKLLRNEDEKTALVQNTLYHTRQAFFTQNFDLVEEYQKLLHQLNYSSFSYFDKILFWLAKKKIRLFWAYKIYFKWAGYGKYFKI